MRAWDDIDVLQAIEGHLAAGEGEAAADLLAGSSVDDLDRVDRVELKAALARIGPALDRAPWAHLAYARLLEVTVHIEERGELLDHLEA